MPTGGDGRGREMCPGTGTGTAVDGDCDGSDLPEAEPPPEPEPEPEPKEEPGRVQRNDVACATGSAPRAAALSLAAAMMSAFARRGRRLR